MTLTEDLLESRISFSVTFRKDINANVTPTDTAKLSNTARLFTFSLTRRALGPDNDITLTEWDLHDLWYIYIQLAKAFAGEGEGQDRLVAQILENKGLGRLLKDGKEVKTSDGVLWNELPFLGSDLLEVYTQHFKDFGVEQRTNLAAFTGRLVATGASDSVYASALWLLTTILEEPDQLNEETLPSIVALLGRCAHKILILALAPSNASIRGSPAEDTTNAVETVGFTLSRWHSWKKTLEQLKDGERSDLIEFGRRGFAMMDAAEHALRL